MSQEQAGSNFISRAKQIICEGGTHEMVLESHESFHDWLLFLTNPVNLQPGLPDLTIISDSRQMDESAIKVSFDNNKASLRSLKLEPSDFLNGITDIFLDNESDSEEFTRLIESRTLRPRYFRKWVYNLFLHTELEELQLPFPPTEIPDLFATVARRKKPA